MLRTLEIPTATQWSVTQDAPSNPPKRLVRSCVLSLLLTKEAQSRRTRGRHSRARAGHQGNHTRSRSYGPQCGPAAGAKLGLRFRSCFDVRHERVWIGPEGPTAGGGARNARVHTSVVRATANVEHKPLYERFVLNTRSGTCHRWVDVSVSGAAACGWTL